MVTPASQRPQKTSKAGGNGGNGSKPHKPYNRRYNRKRVIALAEQGVPANLIAKDQDVATSTITRYLAKHNMVAQSIKDFNSAKADMLSFSQLQNHTIEDIIKSNWINNPDTILSLPIPKQKDVLHTLQGGRWYDHQSERLERDLSTSNTMTIIADLEAVRKAHNNA
jgi:hypothetical protein